MLSVVCVLSGGEYNQSHVKRLETQIAVYLKQPYNFVCIDDSPYPGFWAKISLFEPERFNGRVLYLDLDVTITGNLDEIVNYDCAFGIIKDWNLPGVNSSVMVWNSGVLDHLYTYFTPKVLDRLHGDQNWINEKMLGSIKFPKEWCLSYKKHIRPTGKIPESCKVICYHGKIKPWT